MTLKETLKETMPGKVGTEYYGGVVGCPMEYDFLEGHYTDIMCEEKGKATRRDCEKCWGQKYIPAKSEQVNHPSHYQQEGRRECIEEMRVVFGDEAVRQWCIITAYKYRYRSGNKSGNSAEQDDAKAEWYLDYAEKLKSECK